MDSHVEAEESYPLDRPAGRSARSGHRLRGRANGRPRRKRNAEYVVASSLTVPLRVLAKNKQASLLFALWFFCPKKSPLTHFLTKRGLFAQAERLLASSIGSGTF
jgi:hypothetical protein